MIEPRLARGEVPTPVTILVVDDHAYVRRTICAVLEQQAHWKIYETANGREAVARASELKPDVVIMDIVLPEMKGLAAAYKLREAVPHTKLLLTSGHFTAESAGAFARLFGDASFVHKSSLKDLVAAANRMLAPESQTIPSAEVAAPTNERDFEQPS